jgi:probable phosphomutase (TIGR03848 family)
MPLFYLLRHAESRANSEGILAGRIEGITLSKRGLEQSRELTKALKTLEIKNIYSSPLERCLETVAPFARYSGKPVKIANEFIEMEYGLWSGRKLASLRREKLWKSIQTNPSKVKFPEGESFTALSKRIRTGLNSLAKRHPRGGVLIVSHGDPIKIAISETLGLKIDDFQKIVVDPASLTIIDWPSGILLAANTPLTSRAKSKSSRKSKLAKRRVLGGGTNG